MAPLLLLLGLAPPAVAKAPTPPRREAPHEVLVEVQQIEQRFEQALALDCDEERCFPGGCVYGDHVVSDQPRSRSLPGLGQDPGPGSAPTQAWLTEARCTYTHEAGMEPEEVGALTRRLQARTSTGWTRVSVSAVALAPLPSKASQPPEEPAEQAAPPAPPEPWTAAAAGHELWDTLLPHAFWMVGLGLFSLAGTGLIWSWRRVGRASLEEQALLAQLARGEDEAATEAAPVAAVEETAEDAEDAFVAAQEAAWTARLAALDPAEPDPELHALVRALLRAGEIPLLAKAVLRFPERFPLAFPTGGDVATAKLALARYLEDVDPDALPDDATFFAALNRRALAATLATQPDAEIVRSLREDFGAAGLATLIGRLPARVGALLFALAPAEARRELVRLLDPAQAGAMARQLLRSDRMDPAEAAWLFDLLRATRSDGPPPPPPPPGEVTDRGAQVEAAAALSLLLARVGAGDRARLFAEALQRFGGSLPAWTGQILTGDMLLALGAEARADLLLAVDAEPLAAWVSLLDDETRTGLVLGMPTSLRATVEGARSFGGRERQLALAERARQDLARLLQRHLARSGRSLADLVAPPPAEGALA